MPIEKTTTNPGSEGPLVPSMPPTTPLFFAIADSSRIPGLTQKLSELIAYISCHIDCSSLAAVTVADDHAAAIRELDRGFKTSVPVVPSNDFGVGVAMTLPVLVDGSVRSHIVLASPCAFHLEDIDGELFGLVFQMLAHECAHVEVTASLERAMPGVLMEHTRDLYSSLRIPAAKACWDEYAASRIAAPFGRDPTSDYFSVFQQCLIRARADVQLLVREHLEKPDVGTLLRASYQACGRLLRCASYWLGTVAGLERGLEAYDSIGDAQAVSWFRRYLEALSSELDSLFDGWGKWLSMNDFEPIADIVEDMLREEGIWLQDLGPEGVYLGLDSEDE